MSPIVGELDHRSPSEPHEGQLGRTEAILDGQRRALELAVQGGPIEAVLDILLLTIEAQAGDDVVASVLLLDPVSGRLQPSAAPHLPRTYVDALRAFGGVPVAPAAGSCGTAAYRREVVIVSDIATDPLWSMFREPPLEHGLRACWSTPILSSQGAVLGTFALYYRTPRRPSRSDREAINLLVPTAAIVIERHEQARERLAAERALAAARDDLTLQVTGLERMHALAIRLSTMQDLTEKLQAILQASIEIHGIRRGLLSLYDPVSRSLRSAVSVGFSPDELAQLDFIKPRAGNGACGTAFATRGRVFVEDIETAECFAAYRSVAGAMGIRAMYSSPIMTPAGEIFGVLSVYFESRRWPTQLELQLVDMCVRDAAVTVEAARNRQALRDSERRYRQLVESLPVALFTCDLDSRIVFYNQAAITLWGCEPDSGPGRWSTATRVTTVDGRVLDRDECPLVLALREGCVVSGTELVVVRPDDSRRHVLAHPQPILDEQGKITGALNILVDITERKQVERALRDSEEKFRKLAADLAVAKEAAELASRAKQAEHARLQRLLMDAPMGVAIWRGEDLVYELANPAYERLMNKGALVGRRFRDVWDGALDASTFEHFNRVYRTGEPFITPEDHIIIDRSGTGVLEDCYVAGNVEAIREIDDEISGLMAVLVDVTDQVRARKREQTARAHAEVASRAKDEFLAMLGHELRNPLAPIATALQLLRLRCGAQFGYEHEIIERQVQHLTRLVDDLLDISRITRGKIEIKKQLHELSAIVTRAVEIASPLLEQRQHRLSIEVAPTGLPIVADAGRVAQVISNLLTNAARYTEPGGDITISATCEQDEVVLRVRDTGIGIAPEMLAKIFDLFVQAERPAGQASGGLGLGLTLVRTLVELHGGRVEAYSAGLGEGSEFTVRLPSACVPESSVSEVLSAEATELDQLPVRLLLVDDNVDAAEMLAETLRYMGHEVEVAFDGPQALARLANERFDVGIFDIGLPVMDGYELARRVRQQPELAGMKLFALTGYGQEGDRIRAVEAGFAQHLTKPLEINRLLALLPERGGGEQSRE